MSPTEIMQRLAKALGFSDVEIKSVDEGTGKELEALLTGVASKSFATQAKGVISPTTPLMQVPIRDPLVLAAQTPSNMETVEKMIVPILAGLQSKFDEMAAVVTGLQNSSTTSNELLISRYAGFEKSINDLAERIAVAEKIAGRSEEAFTGLREAIKSVISPKEGVATPEMIEVAKKADAAAQIATPTTGGFVPWYLKD